MAEGIARLTAIDPDLARVLEQCGQPPMRSTEPGFASLLRSIMGQQVSVQSANAIWNKLNALVNPLEPATLLAAGDLVLREAGFSRQKARYAKGLATDILEGRIDMTALEFTDDEAAITILSGAKGIGRWTAEIYLMFALGRPDIMPVADLGIITALQHLKGLSERPHAKDLLEMAEPWRPWRSVACLMLWHYRHNMPV